MKIIWSLLSVDQVRDIASYIALDKPSVAEQWDETIFDSVKRLVDVPYSGRVVPEINRNEIREVVLKNYRVIYKVKENEVLVLLVKNYRQKLDVEEV